jgi:hypothetical protein
MGYNLVEQRKKQILLKIFLNMPIQFPLGRISKESGNFADI